jgi:hypothetical protein
LRPPCSSTIHVQRERWRSSCSAGQADGLIGLLRSAWLTENRIERGVPRNLRQLAVAEKESRPALVALPHSGQGRSVVRVNPVSDRLPPEQYSVSWANRIVHHKQRHSQ